MIREFYEAFDMGAYYDEVQLLAIPETYNEHDGILVNRCGLLLGLIPEPLIYRYLLEVYFVWERENYVFLGTEHSIVERNADFESVSWLCEYESGDFDDSHQVRVKHIAHRRVFSQLWERVKRHELYWFNEWFKELVELEACQ